MRLFKIPVDNPGPWVQRSGDTMTGQLVVPAGGLLVQAQNATTEGGEIYLARGPTSTLAGNVVIDVLSEGVRVFENGGAARGAFIDISACTGGANQPLLRPSQVGQTGKFLRTGGTISSELWDDPGLDHYDLNGDFAIWQYNNPAGFVPVDAIAAGPCDLWSFYHSGGAAQFTWSRQNPGLIPVANTAIRCRRNSASVFANYVYFYHDMEWKDAERYQGRTCTLSFWAKCGANFSSANNALGIQVIQGTAATDANIVYTGYTGVTYAVNSGVGLTTAYQRFSVSFTTSVLTRQLCLLFYFLPSGVAGVDDWFEITGVQLDYGSYAQPFRVRNFQQRLATCQRRYFKSFPYTTNPITGSGITTGCYRFVHTAAGAVTIRGPFYPFPVTQRATPTLTTYNPINVNANPYDDVAAGDCTLVASTASESGARFVLTGNAASVQGSNSLLHFTADARF